MLAQLIEYGIGFKGLDISDLLLLRVTPEDRTFHIQ